MATRRRASVTVSRDDPSDTVLACDDAFAGHPELVINAVWNALTYVYGSGDLDIVSLGLVYDVRDEAGVIVVEMALTGPGDLAGGRLHGLARAAVAEAVGNTTPAEVRVVRDPPWSPAMIDTIAAEAPGRPGHRGLQRRGITHGSLRTLRRLGHAPGRAGLPG